MSRYAGMTTNERLVEADLLQAFGNAARERDRERMIEILGQVEMAHVANQTVDTILANPSRYGY